MAQLQKLKTIDTPQAAQDFVSMLQKLKDSNFAPDFNMLSASACAAARRFLAMPVIRADDVGQVMSVR